MLSSAEISDNIHRSYAIM